MQEINKNKEIDYRFIPVLLLIFYLGLLILSENIWGSYKHIGHYLAINPAPYFADTKVLLCGIEAIRQGIDPYAETCGGPTTYNYPSAWGVLSVFPFMILENNFYVGIGIGLIFYFALFSFLGRLDFRSSLLYGLVLIAPASILAVERGNCDLIIFSLFAWAILSRYSQYLFPLIILTGSILKYFPIGAISALLHFAKADKRKYIMASMLTGILFGLYVFLMIDNILAVSGETPRPYGGASYGLASLPALFSDFYPDYALWIKSIYGILLISCLGIFYSVFKSKFLKSVFTDNKNDLAFITGNSVFIITSFIGYNWEYRLVFLIFTLPRILEWIKSGHKIHIPFLILSLLVFWQSFLILGFNSVLRNNAPYFYFSKILVIILFYYHFVLFIQYIQEKIETSGLDKYMPFYTGWMRRKKDI